MNPALDKLRTPCYVIDLSRLESNLEILADVQARSGCRILLALKGFAAWSTFPLVREYLAGAAASSLHEARLAREEFGGEVHVCAPAYRDDEFDAILEYADHIVFNSFSQWKRFRGRVRGSGRRILCGIRINPQHSEVAVRLYDPCAPGSRLGVTLGEFDHGGLEGISGLHFHTLCELGAEALERTLAAVESKFGKFLKGMDWVNFGGGHQITAEGYDSDCLCGLISGFSRRHGLSVYLEPGEAIALNAGVLISSVVDIVRNETQTAVLDASAAAHMPDVLEMPYRPRVEGAGEPGQYEFTYRLGGLTCLAGDVIGEYSFPAPLEPGTKIVFHDMAHYTMVKNTTFNGLRLPDIVLFDPRTGSVNPVREFGYEDYKSRLS